MTVEQLSLAKKGEPKILSWAAFPDGDLVEYFECKINEGGYWYWRENITEVPEISQVWLTSSHFVRNESIVNSSVSFLVSMTCNDKGHLDMSDLPKLIYEALDNQGPTRNPTFNGKHSVLINSIIAKLVSTKPISNGKWLTQNTLTFRIPIFNFEYDVKNNTEAELLQNQITNYFNALRKRTNCQNRRTLFKRTNCQNRRTLFKMYSMEWINWILFATTINAIFEKIYYDKLYKAFDKLPERMADNLVNNSPGCLNMLINMWKRFWFKELHFGLIVRDFIDENHDIDYFQEYPEIIRSYGMLGYIRVKTDYDQEICVNRPTKSEITNFLAYHVKAFPKVPRNYALERFISNVCAMTFKNEVQTIQEIESTYGAKRCEKCKRKMQLKTSDKKKRQKKQEKKEELPNLIKRNEELLNETRSLTREIEAAKEHLLIVNLAYNSLNE